MNMFDKVVDFFLDSNQKMSKRLMYFIIIGAILLSMDYFFRFSDTYIAEKKIEQLSKINEIVKQDNISPHSKIELLRIEKQVIKRQGFWDKLSDLTSFIQSTISSPTIINNQPNNTKPIVDNLKVEIKNKRSVLWHTITSSWFFIIMMIVVPFVPFTKERRMKNALAFIIMMEIFLAILSAATAYIFALIPIIYSPNINYAINIMSTYIVIMVINKLANKNK